MKIDRNTLIFFDASCLIAAAGSTSGGSGFLLALCLRRLVRAAVSQPVLLEAQRNIQRKLGEEELNSFYRLLVLIPFILAPVPLKEQSTSIREVINEKDQHVVLAAIAVGAQFLVTLDRGLADQVNHKGLSIRALLPGDFIKTVLPKHVDYPSVREEG